MTKKELAAQKHKAGYSCSQAVACAFAEEIGLPEEVLFKVAEGFGAGMGTTQQACGAMTGILILAGLKNSTANLAAPDSKAATMKLSKEISAKFAEKCGAIICKEIKTGKDGKAITSCPDCISYGVEIVQEVLGL